MRWLALLLLLVAGSAEARAIDAQAAHGFSFTVADDLQPLPDPAAGPRVLYTFGRGQPGVSEHWLVLRVETMGGTIGRERLDEGLAQEMAQRSMAAFGGHVLSSEVRRLPWSGFEVDAVLIRGDAMGRQVALMVVQLPVAREAVQLVSGGPLTDEPQIVAETTAMVASVQAPTNWLSDRQRGERLGVGIGKLVGVIFVAVALLVWWRRRRA